MTVKELIAELEKMPQDMRVARLGPLGLDYAETVQRTIGVGGIAAVKTGEQVVVIS